MLLLGIGQVRNLDKITYNTNWLHMQPDPEG